MKVCPYCAEELEDGTIVCRQCRRDTTVPPQWRAVPRRPDERPWWIDMGADPRPLSERTPAPASDVPERPDIR